MPMKTDTPRIKRKVGWIGGGVMGAPMAGHLLADGYPLVLHSRTRDRVEGLLQAGAQWADTPAQVAAQSDVVLTMVGTPQEVEAVYFADDGIFTTLAADSVVVDMGTTPPALAQKIHQRARAAGAEAVDAPVSGGDVGAREARLSIMAGGDEQVVRSLTPLFDCLGTAHHMGPAGSGQHTKLCNQITVAGTMIGVCEALVYAARAGVDADRLVAVIAKGAAACWTLDNLAPRILREDFAPGFMVDHFVKDLGIALAEADNLGLQLPGLQLARDLYCKVQQAGHGRSGTQALIHALRH